MLIREKERGLLVKKIAIINQRYGLEVNGGSELYSRQIAERLTAKYEVEVLTSCAIEYVNWANHYNEGVEKIINPRLFRRTSRRRTFRTPCRFWRKRL